MSEIWIDPVYTDGPYAYDSGFSDLIALVCDGPRETAVNAQATDVRARDLISASSVEIDVSQESVNQKRMAGEGADSNTLLLGNMTIKAQIKMPLLAPAIGWVEPVFARIWDQTGLARWGTASAAIGSLITFDNNPVFAGARNLLTDNIADFAGLTTPFTLWITAADGTIEAVNVIDVSKRARTLVLAAATVHSHAVGELLVARPNIIDTTPIGVESPVREPAFSLISMREGMLSPALINKLTINTRIDADVQVDMEVMALGLIRTIQVGMRNVSSDLYTAWAAEPPLRVVDGLAVSLRPATPREGNFGLPGAAGDPLFQGLQGLLIPDFTPTEISLTVDNHLIPVHTQWSRKSGGDRQRQNRYPFALVSEGRVISGKLSYRSSLTPLQVTERLAGPSGLNGGGLIIDFGIFYITLTEIAWQPSNGTDEATGDVERTIEFNLVADNRDAMPPLEYSSQA